MAEVYNPWGEIQFGDHLQDQIIQAQSRLEQATDANERLRLQGVVTSLSRQWEEAIISGSAWTRPSTHPRWNFG